MILSPPFLKPGITLMPSLILIPQWTKSDKAYLAHELTHAEQQCKYGVFTFWYRYLTSKPFRQATEVEAYQAQIKAGASVDTCAISLVSGYGLGISMEKAIKELSL